jgi:hypothetical protein
VRIRRSVKSLALLVVAAHACGCAHGPRDFGKIESQAPLTRARAVGLGGAKTDSQVVPALIGRLNDTDPVVRLAANEELRKRTGRDFGFVPWASDEERSRAVARWRTWLGHGGRSASPLPSNQAPVVTTLPGKPLAPASGTFPNP